jgi:signal transduction histidine kinase
MGSGIGWPPRVIASLQTRLLVAVSALAIAAVAAVGIAARQTTRKEFRKLQEVVKFVLPSPRIAESAERIAVALNGRCCADDVLGAAAADLDQQTGFIVIDVDTGRALALGGAVADRLRNVDVAVREGQFSVEATREQNGVSEAVALTFRNDGAPRIALADGRQASVHVIPVPRFAEDQPAAAFLGSVDRRLVIATTLIGGCVLLVTWALTRRIVGPIGDLRDAARDLARGNLSRRVVTRGSDEVAELGRGFNAMASELEYQQTLRRNLIHDVAHELRTPLTALRCRLETLIDGLAADPRQALQGANEEVGHLSRLVDDLQELALAEARELRLAVETIAIAPVVESAARAARLEQDPRLRLELDPALTARADAVRLRQVLLNLLTNADRHTAPDGSITVRSRGRDGEAVVEVHNTGASLDDDQLARVFDRFWRADPSRQRATGGSGLGLAIVKHLVEAQGGRVWATVDAVGPTFGFALPAGPRVKGQG